MQSLEIGEYGFVADYLHIAFLIGLTVSYIYFRRTHVSVGGSLAVGYLASGMLMPLNVAMTILISLLGYALIHFVVLKIWLPRPRQIFAIGLFIGVTFGFIWLMVSTLLFDQNSKISSLALVGVIVPGMLCNSLNKQGLKRTLIPMAWMVPGSAALAFLLTVVFSHLVPGSLAASLYDSREVNPLFLFAVSAFSVLMAILVQDGFLKNRNLRTGGYVTAGLLVVAVGDWRYLVLLAVAVPAVYGAFKLVTRNLPLFGKDRFFVLVMTSFFFVLIAEIVTVHFTDRTFLGAENLVFCILPAIIANDLIQHGFRRTAGGMTISLAGCAAFAGAASMIAS